ncbi:TonB-dependent siderophore receptor [Piscinibacter sp. HJYY11]|uniref:TonB-dependent siderophore receptor n=1 Tax=Piscinibacter sp. HJYY11 TaxID=2801333 RepID=UPI00191EFCA4|nr:TonB-dependent siderophore receptor [Piscinibacter sp. HJYY11]MBL0731005.1 TonB-dependent siderophore receptor [Piscinibacter sp. HJYY11]
MAPIRFFRTPAAAAASMLCLSVYAQAPASTNLPPVTVVGRSDPVVSVSGWGVPLSEAPLQASVLSASQMKDRGVQRIADMVKSDASVSDAYNSEGYWDFLAVRGFTLDNRFNYRRDGLPINAETSIPLDNKERLEVLKGTSGIQAGTSAPGGLANLVVKRPGGASAYSATLGWRERNSILTAADLTQRFGAEGALGARLNLAYEDLQPQLRDAKGKRHLAAIATEWRAGADTLVEFEVEHSHRSQPSQPAFSLLGDRVPEPVDPRLNLNNQPWSQPVVMDANNASLRMTQSLGANWRGTLHALTQRLVTDDRLAFPYGCTSATTYYPDRYCPDGTFDYADYRSENERRRSDALEIAMHGETDVGGMKHTLSVGLLQSRVTHRFERQAYNGVGTGTVDGGTVVPANPTLNDENTNRDERSTELFARDAIRLNDHLTTWLGLRHTRLHRQSVRTDGSRDTNYEERLITPSIALSYTFAPQQLVYTSWGRGIESEVVTNRDRFTNRGVALLSTSRQLEAGLKVGTPNAQWGAALFQVVRPQWGNVGACNAAGSCTRVPDGQARHRGLEANAAWRDGPWAFGGSLQLLHARRENTLDVNAEGKRPVNVPERTLKLQARYNVAALPALQLQADAMGVSHRAVVADNSLSIPGYGVMDLAARYEQKLIGSTITWRAGVDNVFNRRAWRESPLQFDHVYLYPLAARTFRASVEVSL